MYEQANISEDKYRYVTKSITVIVGLIDDLISEVDKGEEYINRLMGDYYSGEIRLPTKKEIESNERQAREERLEKIKTTRGPSNFSI